MHIDSIGNLLQEYVSPVNQDAAFDMLRTNDGGLIIATGEYYSGPINISANWVRFQLKIIKIDALNHLEWQRLFPAPAPSDEHNFWKIRQANSNTYVACGVIGDTITGGINSYYGVLAAFNVQGDSLWLRKYRYLNTSYNTHTFKDIALADDGGFILCGSGIEGTSPPQLPGPAQRGCLVKVDQYGCLAPGCQLSTTNIVDGKEFNVSLSPNPASTTVTLNIQSLVCKKYNISIIDQQRFSVCL